MVTEVPKKKCFVVDRNKGFILTGADKKPLITNCDDALREAKNQKVLCATNIYDVYEISGEAKLREVVK